MSIEPRSARMESGVAPPATAVPPVTVTRLFAPVARIVIFPPGPTAAASRRDRSWPVLLTLMATPDAASLFRLMFPPDRLLRGGGAGATVLVSADETVMAVLTAIGPPVE